MLEFTFRPDRPTLRVLVCHDDAEREFDYTAGAERALERAAADGWTVVSIKDDWITVSDRASRHVLGSSTVGEAAVLRAGLDWGPAVP